MKLLILLPILFSFPGLSLAQDIADGKQGKAVDANQLSLEVDKQLDELRGLFGNYAAMVEDVDKGILAINKLGVHYNQLFTSLVKTKNLIRRVCSTQSRLRAENEELRRMANIPRKDLDDFLDYLRSKQKWHNWWSNYQASLIAGITIAGLSFLSGRYSGRKGAIKERMRSVSNNKKPPSSQVTPSDRL